MVKPSNYESLNDQNQFKSSSRVIVCDECGRNNIIGSFYCNKCGQSLTPSCVKCGNTKNLPNATFCNQCGIRIEKHLEGKTKKEQKFDSNSFKNNKDIGFLECMTMKYNIKFYYPSIFMKIEKPGKNSNAVLAFQIMDKNYYFIKPPGITISIKDFRSNSIDLKGYTETEIQNKIASRSDMNLIGCFSTTLGNTPAYQTIYSNNTFKELCIYCINRNRIYTITFMVEEISYTKLVPI